MAHCNLACSSFWLFFPLICSLFMSKKNLGGLDPHFYDNTCPQAQEIVKFVDAEAAAIDGRMPASLLRQHFHD
ncbi:putative peroxidase [Rosa chinensis]|uniref:Putative peroxidase n=1 Tax=Rosa chinensis TaxID=74649 RepID=A0A2P6RM81_ROSCH|nr:putative peroxidase [Rosa chinensis]